ncbi:component of gems protein 1 isoform X2 [Bicyclus anynana]|uniref:Component of gems protein 1 isoform X2 n=1 Tax=Bicyclus anynana TaxID=110368 RepID=A0A6J1MZ80_BICAN|nr:component of gems protein 1 isoform X2 [Bicyclus anynana]
MGKSGKKTKSDRINALRKQYDAFLDEDKKRKDRNEFILGRLEKMRMSTPAVVPVRHVMGNPQINNYNFIPQERSDYVKKLRFDNSILRSREYDASPKCITKDEEILLQEICKKYILIPRLRPINENSVTFYQPPLLNTTPMENIDTDWRNKYNILDELKKIEKEDSSGVSKENSHLMNDKIVKSHELNIIKSNIGEAMVNNTDKDTINNSQQNKMQLNALQTYSPDTVSKIDLESDSNILLERNKNMIPKYVKNIEFENEVSPTPVFVSSNQEEYIMDSNETNKEFYPHENIIQAEQINENMNNEKVPFNQIQNVELNEHKGIHNNVPTKKGAEFVSINTQNVINAPIAQPNVMELSNSDVVHSNITSLNETEDIDLHLKEDEVSGYPVETIEYQEPYSNVGQNETMAEKIPQEYEPPNEATIISDNVISSQINEFETEQKQMFYSEETGYTENVDTVGDTTQNEQYSYYDESQQEQPYYPEVNEHVESTEQYDPSYEQQYVGNYDENVNADYENQQYGLENYENHQEVTNVNYEQHPNQQEIIQHQPDVSTENYDQQQVNYEYQQSGYLDNVDQSHIENTNIYDTQASEHVNYDNQEYNEIGEIEQPAHPDQSTYENQQNYVQNSEHETIQNLEQQLDSEEGYTETKILPNEPATEGQNVKELESNIKTT